MRKIENKKFDYVIAVCVLILLVLGIIMITSIGVPKSIELSAPHVAFPNCDNKAVDCYFLLKKHIGKVFIGLLGLLICLRINYRFWKKISLPLLIIAICSLVAVLIFGSKSNTFAKSWFVIYNTSLQPAEFAKLALILYFSTWLEKKNEEVKTFQYGFIPFCVLSSIVVLPIILQPDFGSTLVFASIAVAIYFAGGARIRDILLGSVIALSLGLIVVLNVSHIRERFSYFVSKQEDCKENYCWQSQQAAIAVGSGGLWGRGITQGIQKSYWLPQATDDFIFAASSEELGFFGSVIWIGLYLVIIYRAFRIAIYAPNRFAMLVATGIAVWLMAQSFLNIAVNISLMPITGVTLPLVSYGGSSLVITLISIGILLNISKYTTGYANNSNRRGDRRSHIPKYSYSRRSL